MRDNTTIVICVIIGFGTGILFAAANVDIPFYMLFILFFFVAFGVSLARIHAGTKKMHNLYEKYGWSQEFIDNCNAHIEKQKKPVNRVYPLMFLALKYHQNGNNPMAIETLKTRIYLPDLTPTNQAFIYNDLMFFYLMEGDLRSADEIYFATRELYKEAKVEKHPAILDTLAVREYIHGNFDESVKLLNEAGNKPKIAPTAKIYTDLHLAWNYRKMGRTDEAIALLKSVAENKTDEYAAKQAYGLLRDMEVVNVT